MTHSTFYFPIKSPHRQQNHRPTGRSFYRDFRTDTVDGRDWAVRASMGEDPQLRAVHAKVRSRAAQTELSNGQHGPDRVEQENVARSADVHPVRFNVEPKCSGRGTR